MIRHCEFCLDPIDPKGGYVVLLPGKIRWSTTWHTPCWLKAMGRAA